MRARQCTWHSLLALLRCGATASLGGRTSAVVVVVVVVVALQDALPQLLLSPVDVRVQLVAVLADRKLLVVIDRDVDTARAHRLILRVVELCHVRVAQRLFSRQAPIRVELQQVAQQVKCIIARRREQVTQSARLGRWQRLKHSRCERAIDRLDIFAGRTARHLHYAVELVESGCAREDRLAEQKLSKDAAKTPHVDTLCVVV